MLYNLDKSFEYENGYMATASPKDREIKKLPYSHAISYVVK